MTLPNDDALTILRAHFEQLSEGATASYEVRYDEPTVTAYAARAQIVYPGRHRDAEGTPLVPLGILFTGPAAVFGLKEGPAGAKGGIFTETNRRYMNPVRIGESVRYEATVTSKFVRNGRFYIEVDWRAFREDGAEAAAGKEQHTLGMVREPRA